jgi:hypothetical protein
MGLFIGVNPSYPCNCHSCSSFRVDESVMQTRVPTNVLARLRPLSVDPILPGSSAMDSRVSAQPVESRCNARHDVPRGSILVDGLDSSVVRPRNESSATTHFMSLESEVCSKSWTRCEFVMLCRFIQVLKQNPQRAFSRKGRR